VALIATVQANQFKGELGSLTSKAGVSTPTAEMTRLASQHGYQMAFFACAALMVLPLVVTFFVDNRKAEDSLKVQLETRQAAAVAATTPAAESAAGGK
jgi:hypothetical protein